MKRNNNSLLFNLFISALLGFIVLVKFNEPLLGLFIGIAIFTFDYYKFQRSDRLFIKDISIDSDHLCIVYFDKKREHILKGLKHQFRIKKERLYVSRFRKIYLVVYKDNKKILEQFEIGEWTGKKMDEVAKWFGE
ncbi:MAG: hypothetical protein H7296_13330 [Bacteroidia bacterium]|nr:hypothetical protein [Bacteroidia bacterium]